MSTFYTCLLNTDSTKGRTFYRSKARKQWLHKKLPSATMKQQRKQNYCHCKNHLIIIISTFFCPSLERGRKNKSVIKLKGLLYWILKILSWFNTGIKNLQIFGRIERKVGCGVDPRHAFATLQLITYAHQHWYLPQLHGPCSSWRGTVWRTRNSSSSSHLHSYVAHFHLSVSKKMEDACTGIFFFHFKRKHLTYTESKELWDMH